MTDGKQEDSRIYLEDLARIAECDFIDWEAFRDRTVLVTGATGVIGSEIVRALITANEKRNLNLTTAALVRNREKAERMFGKEERKGFCLVDGDITEPIRTELPVDYILHGAGVTTSKDFVDHPVRTILTTLRGTENVLEFAREKGAAGMVYFSSMEAYGVVDPEHYIVKETDYGYIDPLSVRSSYSEGKRMAEGLCAAYAHEFHVPVKIARLAQTFGAGIPRTENRVYAQFARSILNGRDIVLHTDGKKAHCYCYTADAVTGVLTILLKGADGEAYNVSNEKTFCTIRDMAEMLIRRYPESGSKLVFDIPEDANQYGYAPTSRMLVDAGKLRRLGWEAGTDLPEMFERLIADMRETGNV